MRLSDRAILLSWRISQWSGMATENNGARLVEASAGAEHGVVKARKVLMPDFPELTAIHKFNATKRVEFNTRTLAYSDGSRLAPVAIAEDLIIDVGEWMKEGEALADLAATAYSDHLDAAEKKLGTLFDRRLYPDITQFRNKFSYRLTPTTVPDTDTLRNFPGFSKDEVDKIVAQAEDSLKESANAAVRDVWERIYNVTTAMHTRLEVPIGDKGSIFRDTLVTNVKELVDLLPKLNLFNDQSITDMVEAMRKELCGANPEVLRTDAAARAERAAKARKLAEVARNYL